MTKGEKDELTNRMAAFILSLEEVDTFVPDTFLLKTTPPDLQRELRNLIATSPSIMKDFVQPYAVTHESGKNPAGFHGKGLNALVNLLDERVNAITAHYQTHGHGHGIFTTTNLSQRTPTTNGTPWPWPSWQHSWYTRSW